MLTYQSYIANVPRGPKPNNQQKPKFTTSRQFIAKPLVIGRLGFSNLGETETYEPFANYLPFAKRPMSGSAGIFKKRKPLCPAWCDLSNQQPDFLTIFFNYREYSHKASPLVRRGCF